MSFRLFDYLDKALVQMEKREDYVSKSARLWASEASAVLLEPGASNIVGGCARKVFYRLIGEKTTSQLDAVGARRVRTGKSVEADTTGQAEEAGIYVASGVRLYVPNIDLAFELDLIVLDPATNQPVICENKSIYGYKAQSDIIGTAHKKGRPKLEHVIQLLLYINEIKTGLHLKQVIADCLEKKPAQKRNRIQVDETNLSLIADNSLIYGKLCYETRDTCQTTEFDVEIYEDFDGLHYPQINGEVWKVFTLESIYDRFDYVQSFFNKAQKEAIGRLTSQGITRPAPLPSDASEDAVIASNAQESLFWQRVGEEMRRLGPEWLPPNDYQYKYSDKKIEHLAGEGLISISKLKEWKTYKAGRRRKPGVPIIGDWQCAYCNFRLSCIPLQNPELAGMCADLIVDKDEDEEEKEGE